LVLVQQDGVYTQKCSPIAPREISYVVVLTADCAERYIGVAPSPYTFNDPRKPSSPNKILRVARGTRFPRNPRGRPSPRPRPQPTRKRKSERKTKRAHRRLVVLDHARPLLPGVDVALRGVGRGWRRKSGRSGRASAQPGARCGSVTRCLALAPPHRFPRAQDKTVPWSEVSLPGPGGDHERSRCRSDCPNRFPAIPPRP
jgi:hypothetical protein